MIRRASAYLRCLPAVFPTPQGCVVAPLCAILLLADPASPQIVTGRVVNAESEPVGDARISLLDMAAVELDEARSNADGEFIIVIMDPGTYLLRVSRLGHDTLQTPPIEIAEGEVVEVELRLDVEAGEAEPPAVVERRRETRRERDLREFYERVDLQGESHVGTTQIYTRESLEEWNALSLEDLFRYHVRWSRLGCNPRVFLDGDRRALADVSVLSVSSVEGIELYAFGGPPRSRFWDPNGCGVLLVWTRLVREGRTRLGAVEVVALVAAAVLLMLGGLSTIF